MFFKMLKNDLRLKKGLNIILFLFIVLASVLMFIAASQLYMQLTGADRTAEITHMPDIMVMFHNTADGREQELDAIQKKAEEFPDFTESHFSEALSVKPVQLDFERVNENDQESFFEPRHFLMKQPRDCNLLFDLDDKPFYVQNGTVWISHKMRDVTGSRIGDNMKIITPMGRVYELEIAGFYKEPTTLYLFRYLLSDDDYATIADDFPVKTDILSLFGSDAHLVDYISDIRKMENVSYAGALHVKDDMTDDFLIGFIITVAITLISIFLLIIILMTIRFTMVAAMRDEEKEIGMMRAIGVDSLRFRWLFAAKYIAFAVIGGVIGVLAGLPLSRKVMAMFAGGIILPQTYTLILVGTVSALLMAGAIILFSLLVMRRIKRISVVDALHGENRGERFGKVSALLLHKRKKMPVSLFLAVSDILTRLKRYLFLIITYTLGGLLMLLTSYLYHSVISVDFMKYSLVYDYDFFPDFSDDMMKEYEKRGEADNLMFWDVFNQDLENNNIKAHADCYSVTFAELPDYKLSGQAFFAFDNPDPISYSEGRAPVLANEAAISSFSARKYGIQVGDELRVSLAEYTEDGLSSEDHERKIIITGMVDYMEYNGDVTMLIMGREYNAGYAYTKYTSGMRIYGEDRQAEFDKMVALFGGHMMTSEEALNRDMEAYDLPLRLLRDVVTGTVIFVNILLTMLYMNIFLAEDKPEIALQRCIGFRDGKIRASQLIRMLLLTVFSVLAAILLATLLSGVLFELLFSVIGLSGFKYIPMPVFTWVIMPLISLLTVLIPTLIKLRSIGKIDISSIANE